MVIPILLFRKKFGLLYYSPVEYFQEKKKKPHMKETIIGGRVRYEDPELNSQMQSSSYFSFMDRH